MGRVSGAWPGKLGSVVGPVEMEFTMNRVKNVREVNSARARIARAVCGLAVSVFALASVPAALGQSALGNGQGLQKNLHRFNQSLPSRDALASSRFQNSKSFSIHQ